VQGAATSVHYTKDYPGLFNLGRAWLSGRMKRPTVCARGWGLLVMDGWNFNFYTFPCRSFYCCVW
jgi:hypothetical protein